MQYLPYIWPSSRGRLQKDWVFASNSDFLIPISLQLDVVELYYIVLWILLDQIVKVWNCKGLHHQIAKVYTTKLHRFKDLSLWTKLNSSITTLLQLDIFVFEIVVYFVKNKCVCFANFTRIKCKNVTNTKY